MSYHDFSGQEGRRLAGKAPSELPLTEPTQAELLRLQRLVGNRALASLFVPDLMVQRHALAVEEEAPELAVQRSEVPTVQGIWLRLQEKIDSGHRIAAAAITAAQGNGAKPLVRDVARLYGNSIQWRMLTRTREKRDNRPLFVFGDNQGDRKEPLEDGIGGMYRGADQTVFLRAYFGGRQLTQAQFDNSIVHEGTHALSHILGTGGTPTQKYRRELKAYWGEARPEFAILTGVRRAKAIRQKMLTSPETYPYLASMTEDELGTVEADVAREMGAGQTPEQVMAAFPPLAQFMRQANNHRLGAGPAPSPALVDEVRALADDQVAVYEFLQNLAPTYNYAWYRDARGPARPIVEL